MVKYGLSQNGIHAGLVALALALEPHQYIRVNTHRGMDLYGLEERIRCVAGVLAGDADPVGTLAGRAVAATRHCATGAGGAVG